MKVFVLVRSRSRNYFQIKTKTFFAIREKSFKLGGMNMKKKLMRLSQQFSRAVIQPVMFLAIMGLVLALAVIMQLKFMPSSIIFIGTLLKSMMDTMLNNLSIIFCVGLSAALAKTKKVDAAIVGLITYLIFLSANNAWLTAQGMLAQEGAVGLYGTGQNMVLGFQVIDMNVFLGLILGCLTGYIHNKFCDKNFSEMFRIYGGSRLVFLIMIPITLILAIVLSYIWPIVNTGISIMSDFMKNTDTAGIFVYAFGNRFLIPTGLHHLLWMPFCFTGFGGTLEIGGSVVQGAANIFYAEMGNASTLEMMDSSIRFATFGFAKIFGSIGIGLALIRCAKPQYKQAAKGMILPSVFVAAVAGITEPLDFSFLFISPFLWLVHSLITAISEVLLWILGSRTYALYGLLDTIVCNSVIDPKITKIYIFFLVGIIMTIVWYYTFSILIKKFDIKTLGRDEQFLSETSSENEEISRQSKEIKEIEDAKIMIDGLGGKENIEVINNCFTRLRCDVKDVSKVKVEKIKEANQKGVIVNGNNVQIIIGLKVESMREVVDNQLKLENK